MRLKSLLRWVLSTLPLFGRNWLVQIDHSFLMILIFGVYFQKKVVFYNMREKCENMTLFKLLWGQSILLKDKFSNILFEKSISFLFKVSYYSEIMFFFFIIFRVIIDTLSNFIFHNFLCQKRKKIFINFLLVKSSTWFRF